MSRNSIITTVVVLVLLAFGVWIFTRQTQSPPESTLPLPTPTPTIIPESTDSGQMNEVKEVKVSGGEFSFSPNSLTLKMGEKARIVFQNDGKFPHNLMIDELKVATKTISSGQTDTVEFTADKSGSFEMYCSVSNHRKQGMEGTVQIQN